MVQLQIGILKQGECVSVFGVVVGGALQETGC